MQRSLSFQATKKRLKGTTQKNSVTMKTAKEIRNAKPEGKMTKSGKNIKFDNGVVFEFPNSKEQQKTWNKLKRMGYQQHYNLTTDEDKGLAAANPEEAFNYQIIEK